MRTQIFDISYYIPNRLSLQISLTYPLGKKYQIKMGSTNEGSYTAPAEEVSFAGLLFDLDGTIIDSTDAVVKHWHQ